MLRLKSFKLAVLVAGLLLDAGVVSAQATEAYVSLSNCGTYTYTGLSGASGSVKTTSCGPSSGGGEILAEGSAGFSGDPMVALHLTGAYDFSKSLSRGTSGVAYIDDYLTFNVAGGGSATVLVTMSGSYYGKNSPTFEADLGFGSFYQQYKGSLTDSIDGNPGSDIYFIEDAVSTMPGFITGSYIIDNTFTVSDGATFELLVGLKASASGHTWGNAEIYIDDPLSIQLSDGVTYTALSGHTYDVTAAVPEPEIYAMMGVGLGLLGWVGRRNKLQAASLNRPSR